MIAGWKMDVFRNFGLSFGNDTFDVTAECVEADINPALKTLAAD